MCVCLYQYIHRPQFDTFRDADFVQEGLGESKEEHIARRQVGCVCVCVCGSNVSR